jgi:hypothetical protein
MRARRPFLAQSSIPAAGRNARGCSYNGVNYRSKDEAGYAERLDVLIHAGQVRAWRKSPSFALVVNSIKVGRYTPDFEVVYMDGHRELVEVKGWASPDYRLRSALFRACYPGEVLQVVDGKGRPWVDPATAARRRKEALKRLAEQTT